MTDERALPTQSDATTAIPELMPNKASAEFERQLAVGRRVMKKYENVLRELAKS